MNGTETTIDLADKLETLKVNQNGLDIQQIASPTYDRQFKPNHSAVTNYGYHDKDFWVRFSIKSTSSTDWYLMLDYLILGKVDIFILPKSKNPETIRKSDSLFTPVKQHRTPTWKLILPEDEELSVYLRTSNPKDALLLSIQLMQESDFLIYNNMRYIFFSMILAGVLILAVYNLFLALSLQDKSYIVLVIFILLLTALNYRPANFFPSLYSLLVDPNNWYHIPLVSLTQAIAAYYWHMIHHNTEIWLENFTKWLAWLSFLSTAIISVYPSNGGVILFLLIPGITILPILMIRAIIYGHQNILSNFLSMLVLVISIGIYHPLYTGKFPEYPLESYNIGQVGTLLAILLFSLNHAGRTRHILKKAERAETNNKATHNFLTTMSHELRTPMHTILGVNELLRTTPLNQKQQNYLNSSELASRQLLGLVDDVLDTARLQSSQPILIEKKPFSLKSLLKDIEKMYGIQASRKQLKFIVNAQKIPSNMLVGDKKCLNQILTNLIANAIKYTHSGKITLLVNTDTQTNGNEHKNNHIRFTVQDTGPGIPEKYHALLFQPFFQVNSNHARSQEGAGLGLAISHKLVQLLGGQLQLQSTPGKGSSFFFTLDLPICNEQFPIQDEDKAPPLQQMDTPLKSTSVTATSAPSTITIRPKKKPMAGLKILLVDDGNLNLMIGEQLLTFQGADVTLAQSGKDALGALTKTSFNLVLMDVSMPGMDGYQTTRSIRQNSKFKTLPIIALTAHAVEGEKERCLDAGMNDYLSKPFQMEDLLQLTDRYC